MTSGGLNLVASGGKRLEYAAPQRRNPSVPRSFARTSLLSLFLALYATGRIVEMVPSPMPHLAVVAVDVLSALGFAVVHGAGHYRLRGILVFAGISIGVGNLVENLGVATGFPFGHYYFAGLMGPKLFHVPILLGAAYIGMGYVSWTLARLVVGSPQFPAKDARIVALPLVASFIMVAWDLAQDPVWATVLHGWVWRDGGPWFGVPISNFLGWYANVFVIYLLFALYLERQPVRAVSLPKADWAAALLFYAICAAGNALQSIPHAVPQVVSDPSGRQWRVADIAAASALVSIFAMGAFAALAGVKLVSAPAADFSDRTPNFS